MSLTYKKIEEVPIKYLCGISSIVVFIKLGTQSNREGLVRILSIV